MKRTVTYERTAEVEFDSVHVDVAVRYGEEDMPNDAPFHKGDNWEVTIDADTGTIRDWSQGQTLDLYMKVCDCGNYSLLNSDGFPIASIEQNYVPDGFPGEHYGDYIIFSVNENGFIKGWDFGRKFAPEGWTWK
jgi:hypothetical protein